MFMTSDFREEDFVLTHFQFKVVGQKAVFGMANFKKEDRKQGNAIDNRNKLILWTLNNIKRNYARTKLADMLLLENYCKYTVS